MKASTFFFVFLPLASLFIAVGGYSQSQSDADQTTARIGKFIDPSSAEEIGKLQSTAQSAHDAKNAQGLLSQGKYQDFLSSKFETYQNSKVGLLNFLRKIQEKTQSVISKASERVDKWRTTVPKLRSYAREAERFADDSYDFAKTFEMSDLWDINRDFSKEMEWRISQGRRLGLSTWDFLVSRIDQTSFLQGIENILFPDYGAELEASALNGFTYNDAPSDDEKIPIYVLQESLDALASVEQMAEAEYSPSSDAPSLSSEEFDNHRIRAALFDSKSGYTDEVSLRQDILSKEYEISVKRSLLRDKTARLELLWGKLAAQKLEAKETQTAAVAGEVSRLSGTPLDPSAWIMSRFGLSDPSLGTTP